MLWPNSFQRRDENTVTYWGHTFQLTPEHSTEEQILPLKFSYDVLGERCLDILNEICPAPVRAPKSEGDTQVHETDPWSKPQPPSEKPLKPKRDLYLLLRDNHDKHPELDKLWTQVNTVPDWVDWDQIERGQDVFYRYGGAALTGLAFQSLLGGMGAARVVEVLARTGGFSVKVARHRLFETTQHILECTRSRDSIKPGGAGFASSIRVRLLHAAVRHRILKLVETRPEYFDVQKNGVPINDFDCMTTIASFSSVIIWLSLPRQGIYLREQEIIDYIALWRLIAYYTGTPTEYFSSPKKAKIIMEVLLMYEINPSPTSKVLAANIIRSLEDQPPVNASRQFFEATARWLNGDELCDALDLGRPSLYYKALIAGQCLFFMGICYTYRSIPSWDRKKGIALRKIFWSLIVEGKYGLGQETVFDFKYVPNYDIDTKRAGDEKVFVSDRLAETRSRNTLLIAAGGLAVVGYIGWKIVSSVISRVF